MTYDRPIPTSYGAPGAVVPRDQRDIATWSHLVPLIAMIVSAGTLGFVGSLAMYAIYRDRGSFARQHAATSLNVQITEFVFLVIGAVLWVFGVGILIYAAAFVVAFIVHVMGVVAAHAGRPFHPPFILRLVS